MEDRIAPAVFVVNLDIDQPDANPGDGHADIDLFTPGDQATLRSAIQEANALAGADTVNFNIFGGGSLAIIAVGSPLPTITDRISIFGGTQTGTTFFNPGVNINGSAAGAGANGLEVVAGNSVIEGLIINNFDGSGVVLREAGNNILENLCVGTDNTGMSDQGNHQDGIFINNVPKNTIQTSIISGNDEEGIEISGSGAVGSTVQYNTIGLNKVGTGAISNTLDGILIHNDAHTTSVKSNFISGNQLDGVRIVGANATDNLLTANKIGTDIFGANAVPNAFDGVFISNAPNNTIGSTLFVNDGNVISGNGKNGVEIFGASATGTAVAGNFIGTNEGGTLAVPNSRDGVLIDNASGTMIGFSSDVPRNVISGNSMHGVEISGFGATGNFVLHNFIGTDKTGAKTANDLGNGLDGILISDAPGNFVGNATLTAGNIISGNHHSGIEIMGDQATNEQIVNNYIGTDVSGTIAFPNLMDGVRIDGAPDNVIGGTNPGELNLISANGGNGVQILGTGATGNRVVGNFIGTNKDAAPGGNDIGNIADGVFINNVPDNVIGGSTAGMGNVISGNHENGVEISGVQATRTRVFGNIIGLDKNGDIVIGNGNDGVLIDQAASGNQIGISGDGGRNIISGNKANGIEISGAGATRNAVLNNYIGTDKTGNTEKANQEDGVLINDAPENIIGDANEETKRLVQGNLISGNKGDGVEISGGGASANRLLGNFIGTNFDTTADVRNTGNGVLIDGAPDNIIGSPPSGVNMDFRNIISGNGVNGVFISGGGASGTFIQGNFIGTDVNGTAPFGGVLGNLNDGVLIMDAPNTLIGSRNTSPDSVISGNGANGVEIRGAGATGTRILTIKIGVDFFGNALGNLEDGVKIDDAATTEVRKSILSSNGMNGVHILGTLATGNVLNGCSVGVGEDGTSVLGNKQDGVLIEGGASGNFIGTATTHNTISGNKRNGVEINGNGTNGNVVQGNFIGTNSDGSVPLVNGNDGVLINNGAANNIVGGAATLPGKGPGNVISGNTVNGVEIDGLLTNGNTVEANVIGAQGSGANPLPNGNDGVLIGNGANGNTVGGVGFGLHNIISGNGANGIEITGVLTDLNLVQNNSIGVDTNEFALANGHDGVLVTNGATKNTIGLPGVGLNNIISGNIENGVEINGGPTSGNIVQNNDIGVDGGAAAPIPNGKDGVLITNGATKNTIGLPGVGLNNIISGNIENGVEINGGPTSGNIVQNNDIGVDGGAAAPIPNGKDGVLITNGAFGNDIGMANGGNVISGNARNGVEITGAGVTLNNVFANFIGTDLAGTAKLPNTLDGILITNGATFNSIGGINAGEGNVISGNGGNGAQISGAGTNGNSLSHNLIGTNATGIPAIGNTADGVRVTGAPGNFIGKPGANGGNLISGNGSNGVHILNAGATGNLVQNNFIGSNAAGNAGIPNTDSGVLIENANGNTIGGVAPSDNLIAFNGSNGVTIASGTGNRIQGNAIFSNTGLGIDLGNDGVTLNDPDDSDTGANNLQNFPVINSALFKGAGSDVTLSLDSTPNLPFTIELFSNPAADPTGFGEGKTFLLSTVVITDATGHAITTVSSPLIGLGQILTATATDIALVNPSGTSEFSRVATVIAPISPTVNDVKFTSVKNKITGVVFKFSEKLNASTAQDMNNFGLFTAGKDKLFGTADDVPIKISSITYDPNAVTVTLTTAKGLSKNQFIEVFVGGTHGVTDLAANSLDGEFTKTLPSGDGLPGGDFKALVATGTAFSYNDADGDKVSLKLSRGGSMELIRTLDGEGRLLELSNVVSSKSVLSGSVTRGKPAPPADGVTTLQSITGLDGAINHLPVDKFIIAKPPALLARDLVIDPMLLSASKLPESDVGSPFLVHGKRSIQQSKAILHPGVEKAPAAVGIHLVSLQGMEDPLSRSISSS